MDNLLSEDWECARRLLCRLGDDIRESVTSARAATDPGQMAAVAEVTAADTIYQIDKVSEAAVLGWLGANWPAGWPVQLVMEGIDEHRPTTFPRHTPVGSTRFKLIVDPIDGTRSLMYDKRSGWALAALAPQRGPATNFQDIMVAVMTELPPSKQWRADQISAVRGGGLVMEGINALRPAERFPIYARPSRATDYRHGFASLVKFFPEGKGLTAQIEESLWDQLLGRTRTHTPVVFDDQYLCTGGQIYELLTGRDRMVGDIRPLVLSAIGYGGMTMCHPYDICTGMLLTEAGGVLESPDGRRLTAPLDTTTPVAWIGFANEILAQQVRPVLRQLCSNYIGTPWQDVLR